MHEVVDPLTASEAALRLCKFVVMMRELEVISTSMNVHVIPKDVTSHHRAFDMPTWATHSPRTLPGRLPGLGLLPKSEISLCPLLSVSAGNGTLTFCKEVRASAGAELWVIVTPLEVRLGVEIYRAVAFICVAIADDLLDEGTNLRDIFGDTCEHIRTSHSEGIHVLHELRLKSEE